MADEKIKPKKIFKFPIFDALAAVDVGDSDWFGKWERKASEEDKKDFSAHTFIRWVTSIDVVKTAQALQLPKTEHAYIEEVKINRIVTINRTMNPHMYDIHREHPELTFRLACICNIGVPMKYTFEKGATRKSFKNRATEFLGSFYPSANDDEIDMLMRMHTRKSFKSFLEDAAVSSEEFPELMKSYDKLKEIKTETVARK